MDLAKTQSVGSGGGERKVRGYKRWQLQRRWGGALGFVRSGSRERERRVLVVYAFPWGCGSSSAGCRTIEKSKENLRFFNIFSLEASKTNGFWTFWF